jgi:hypothetical protein
MPFYPFNTNTHETEVSLQLGRALGALRSAVKSLENHYASWLQRRNGEGGERDGLASARHARLFCPYKTCYAHANATIDFRYLKRMDDTKLLFLCQTNQAKKLFVKFTRKYCKAAHEYCTDNGVAPELHAVETLPGGWFMVVMEYLDDKSYELLLTSSVNRVDLTVEVRQVVGVLHAGGFVHGDICDVNLMVRRKWSDADNPKNVLLVDFDWAAPKEDTRYPPNVNCVNISRPCGTKDGELITQDHDQTMVDKMFP